MDKRYISASEVGGWGAVKHGYVHETWGEQLTVDSLAVKAGKGHSNPNPVSDLSSVGGFIDPVTCCAYDGQAGSALEKLQGALVGLRDALKPFESDGVIDKWAVGTTNMATYEASSALGKVSVGFTGFFANVFESNKRVCLRDGANLFLRVTALIDMTAKAQFAAAQEQRRRERAKEIYAAHYKWWTDHKAWEPVADQNWDYEEKKKLAVQVNDDATYDDLMASPPPNLWKEPELTRSIYTLSSILFPTIFPDPVSGLNDLNGDYEGYDPSTANETTTSAIPENLRAWGRWWSEHRDAIVNAIDNVVEAYVDGRFSEAAVQTGSFGEKGLAELMAAHIIAAQNGTTDVDRGSATAVGKPEGTPGWKWGQIAGLCGPDGSGGFLDRIREFVFANDNEALALECIAKCFEEADSGAKLEYEFIQGRLDDLYRQFDLLDGETPDGHFCGVELGYARKHISGISDFGFSGVQPSSGYAYDPVNVATGALTEVETDVQFAGSASSFALTRTYNAGDKTGGVFGSGWFSVFDERLEATPSEVGWRRADGALVRFDENPASSGIDEKIEACSHPYWLSYGDTPAVFADNDELWGETGRVFCVSNNAGDIRVFNREGVLLGFAGGTVGDTVVCQRDDQGRIRRLVHASGKYVECEYTGSGAVSRVGASDGREVVYSYVDNRLVSVASPHGVREYVWDEEAEVLSRTVDESGVVLMENTFDQYGRVVTQKTPEGRTAEFVYLPSGVCMVRDANVEGDSRCVDKWVSDKDARLVGVIDSHGAKMSITRDRFGNPVSVVDREGRETLRVFDARSRMTLQVSPEGVRTSMEWDEWDRNTRIVRYIPSLDNGEATVEETILVYLDPADTNGLIVRTPVSVVGGEGVSYTFEHDEAGRVVMMCAASGYRLAFTYDETSGDLTSITNALGQTARLTYDATGNVTSLVSPSGALTRFEWDDAGHALRRIDPDGAVYESVYEHGRLVSYIAPDGGTTTYAYGGNGKIVSVTNPLGRVTQLTHDDQGNTATITRPDGSMWQTFYDSMSRLTKILAPTGDEWTYSYTANGDLESITSPTGLISTLAKTLFNGGTQVDGITSVPTSAITDDSPVIARHPLPSTPNCASGEKQSQHGTVILDALGRPVKVVSPDENILEARVYDKAGRLTELLDAEAGLTRYEYNELGVVSRIINPDETVTEFIYDEGARLVKKTFAPSLCGEGSTSDEEFSIFFEEYSYDADGRVIAVVNQDGNEETFTYDACGRITSHTAPQDGTSIYSYDVCGRIASITDGLHGTRTFTYDVAGQLVSATDANGNATTYTYTANGQLESVTVPSGGTTRFEYDCYGNMVKKTDSLGRSETRTYDSIGNLLSLTRADNTGLKYEYDLLGRLVEVKNHKGGSLATYDYDTSARTFNVADSLANTEHTLSFDRLGRLVSKTTGDTTVAYTYNKTGERTSMTVTRQNGESPTVITYGYGSIGQLVEVTHSTFGVLTSSSLPLSSSLREASDGTISRDETGRITRVVTSDSDVSYGYDAAGQLTCLTDNCTGEITAYVYDSCGRLTTITSGEGETRFVYNQAGELTSRTLPDGTTIAYAYDECGRRVSETLNGATVRAYEWDNLGYLARVTSSSREGDATEVFSLSHDIFGDLATLTSGEENTQFVWDTGVDVPSLLQAGNQDVFTVLGHTAYGTPEENTGWVNHGWRSVRPTNPASPWGLPPEIASSGASAFLAMTGDWNVLLGGSVSVFGLELMGARTYDPFTHGFLSIDPLPPVPGTPYAGNPYEYAGNNPLALFDPLGLRALSDIEFQEMATGYDKVVEDSGKSGWERDSDYIIGGAALVIGGILVVTGVGTAAGLALMSFGGDVLVQKITTGSVDYSDAAISGAFGLVGGPVSIASKGGKLAKLYNKIDNIPNPIGRKAAQITAKGTENATDGIAEEFLKDPSKITTAEGRKDLAKTGFSSALSGGASGAKSKNIASEYNPFDDVKHSFKKDPYTGKSMNDVSAYKKAGLSDREDELIKKRDEINNKARELKLEKRQANRHGDTQVAESIQKDRDYELLKRKYVNDELQANKKAQSEYALAETRRELRNEATKEAVQDIVKGDLKDVTKDFVKDEVADLKERNTGEPHTGKTAKAVDFAIDTAIDSVFDPKEAAGAFLENGADTFFDDTSSEDASVPANSAVEWGAPEDQGIDLPSHEEQSDDAPREDARYNEALRNSQWESDLSKL